MKYFLTKNFALILIVVLAAFLRFWQLGNVPPSLYGDEVSNGYNAYSIVKTARDEYGNFMPLTFKAFGDYNLPLSVYTLVPTIAIFGLNEIGVRFPSAFLGTLTVLCVYFLTLKVSKSRKTAVFASLFLAISPWHLQFSRFDHEANFMAFFVILGATLFMYSSKKFRLLLLSAISLGLALNTYHGAKVFVPLFILVLILLYPKQLRAFKHKLIWIVLILLISIIPILSNFRGSLIRGQSVGVLGREKPLETFISGYLTHFSPKFLFVAGDNQGRHSVPGMGELYAFQAPLVLLGLVSLIKNKSKGTLLILLMLLLSAVPPAAATPTPHALRGIIFAPVWSIVSAFGLTWILGTKIKTLYEKAILLFMSVVAFYNLVTYFHLYYVHYPKEKAYDWQDGFKEMMTYVSSIQDSYGSVAITKYYGFPYIYTLFYTKYHPSKYIPQSENKDAFDKYEFFGPSWGKTKPGKALVVTPGWQAHPDKILKEIYATSGDLTFIVSEQE